MQDNSAIVRRFIEETINQGQIDSVGHFVWEDVTEQVPFPGQGPGLEGLKDVLRGMRAAFPDLYFSVEEQIAEGDKVLTRFEWTGTHQGEFRRARDRTVREGLGHGRRPASSWQNQRHAYHHGRARPDDAARRVPATQGMTSVPSKVMSISGVSRANRKLPEHQPESDSGQQTA
jgi:predicted ester cyclase